MKKQLGFDLPSKPALGREDFLVAPSNALAVALIEAWPDWQSGKLVVTGPEAAGKTHLAHVWAARSEALVLDARALAQADIPSIAQQPVAVEDIPQIAGQNAHEAALFHLHNMVLANGHSLLITGRGPIASWGLSLPDLVSRLQGALAAELAAPDDALLAAVLAKQFNDRQIMPKPDVIPYLLSRMDRSFAAATETVALLDRASLAQKKPITRHLVAQTLDSEG